MSVEAKLRELLELEERETVGTAFGGSTAASRSSYSVPRIRDFLASAHQSVWAVSRSPLEQALVRMRSSISKPLLGILLASLVRFSFLIELTNLKIGSTKMKTRWLRGRIWIAQDGSFEPVQGVFGESTDPRAATFDDCLAIFVRAAHLVCDQIQRDVTIQSELLELHRIRRVPYEVPLGYASDKQNPLHREANVVWVFNSDTQWLLQARRILHDSPAPVGTALAKIANAKLKVKVYKTDRSLTGRDKTNRAKRWEVLEEDFQHASLAECWSCERKLTHDLVCFDGFPESIRTRFVDRRLVSNGEKTTRCPVTLEVLDFEKLSRAVLAPALGVSQYQIGHLRPLKSGGDHSGENVCWQSADGNRIQGDLSVSDTIQLLNRIAQRRSSLPT